VLPMMDLLAQQRTFNVKMVSVLTHGFALLVEEVVAMLTTVVARHTMVTVLTKTAT